MVYNYGLTLLKYLRNFVHVPRKYVSKYIAVVCQQDIIKVRLEFNKSKQTKENLGSKQTNCAILATHTK